MQILPILTQLIETVFYMLKLINPANSVIFSVTCGKCNQRELYLDTLCFMMPLSQKLEMRENYFLVHKTRVYYHCVFSI